MHTLHGDSAIYGRPIGKTVEVFYGPITSVIKLAIKLTIKLKTYKLLQLHEAAFCCSYNKNANEGCNSCAPPPAPVYRRRRPRFRG